ncbi:PH domain-containing protein [Trichostrongylus colubriformis]|uniref:PH domain-containing protein n=1 Tax=Trichostrongylus colubriformis TaxID=6319 RepID=A0AAN8FXP5_TRICO
MFAKESHTIKTSSSLLSNSNSGAIEEFVKYTARANQNSKSMQKALELTMAIPQRVHDLVYTNNIQHYPGDTNKLGRLIRHDSFEVAEGDESPKQRYVFLFKNKLMITEKNASTEPATYTHLATIRLDKYTVTTHVLHEDTILLKPNEPGLPSFSLKPKDIARSEYVRKAWVKDINEEQEAYGMLLYRITTV